MLKDSKKRKIFKFIKGAYSIILEKVWKFGFPLKIYSEISEYFIAEIENHIPKCDENSD